MSDQLDFVPTEANAALADALRIIATMRSEAQRQLTLALEYNPGAEEDFTKGFIAALVELEAVLVYIPSEGLRGGNNELNGPA